MFGLVLQEGFPEIPHIAPAGTNASPACFIRPNFHARRDKRKAVQPIAMMISRGVNLLFRIGNSEKSADWRRPASYRVSD